MTSPAQGGAPSEAPHLLVEAAIAAGVSDARLLEALREVPRSRFVPPAHAASAALDMPLPIGHAQVTTQPSLVAMMLEALGLAGEETVLELGSGYGYQTALLARLARFVWGIEWWPDLAAAARANLAGAGVVNARVLDGDGTIGLAAHAPFDAIVVSAAFPRVPPPLVEQLVPGGRLVQPIGRGGDEQVEAFVKRDGGLWRTTVVTLARFVPLRGRHGYEALPAEGP